MLQTSIIYRTRANICRGLYTFHLPFHCGLYCTAVSIIENLSTKNENCLNFGPKLHGLNSRAVSNQDWVIMAGIRLLNHQVKENNNLTMQGMASNSSLSEVLFFFKF